MLILQYQNSATLDSQTVNSIASNGTTSNRETLK